MSLQITELRVGNLLKVDKNIWTVEDIINGDSTWELYFKENPEYNHWVNAEPIKISNDWLVKLGFKLYPSGYYCLDIHGEKVYISIGLKHDTEPNLILDSGENALSFNLKHIKYVHQLQNLFFALTGVELSGS